MANRYVRMYSGPEKSTMIGFSAGAIPDNEAGLHQFFQDRGYETHQYERHGEVVPERDKQVLEQLGGVSFMYLGIKPPIAEKHVDEFAGWCKQNVDPYHNSGLLLDNRGDTEVAPFSTRNIIAEW